MSTVLLIAGSNIYAEVRYTNSVLRLESPGSRTQDHAH